MSSFRGVDYLHIDSLFHEQELLVRRTARHFASDRVIPVIRDCFRDARFPIELIPEMGRLGFFGANLEGYLRLPFTLPEAELHDAARRLAAARASLGPAAAPPLTARAQVI